MCCNRRHDMHECFYRRRKHQELESHRTKKKGFVKNINSVRNTTLSSMSCSCHYELRIISLDSWNWNGIGQQNSSGPTTYITNLHCTSQIQLQTSITTKPCTCMAGNGGGDITSLIPYNTIPLFDILTEISSFVCILGKQEHIPLMLGCCNRLFYCN